MVKVSLSDFVKLHNYRESRMTFDSKRDMNTTPCYAHVNFYANEKHIMSICADNQAKERRSIMLLPPSKPRNTAQGVRKSTDCRTKSTLKTW